MAATGLYSEGMVEAEVVGSEPILWLNICNAYFVIILELYITKSLAIYTECHGFPSIASHVVASVGNGRLVFPGLPLRHRLIAYGPEEGVYLTTLITIADVS